MKNPTVNIQYAITMAEVSYRVLSQDKGETVLIRRIPCASTPSAIDFLRIATELGAILAPAYEIGEVSTIYPNGE